MSGTTGTPSLRTVAAPGTAPTLPEQALSRPPLRGLPRHADAWRWVAALTAAGFAVRLAFADAQSFWLDETLSVAQAGLPLGQLWEFQLTRNVHVPGYHTLLHFWMLAFGTGEVGVRMLSVVLGTAAVPLMFLLGRRLLGERAGVVSAAVAAGAPFWVWHADEARMYPMMLTVGLAGMVLLLAALDHGGPRWWTAYALAIAVSTYTHYFMWLMPPVHLAVVLLRRPGWRRFLAWAGATAAGLATFLPWLYLFVTRRLTAPGGQEFTNHLTGSGDHGFFAALYATVIFVAVYVVGYHSAGVLEVFSGVLVGVWPLAALTLATRRRHLTRRQLRTVGFLLGWLVWIVGAGYLIDQVMPGAWYQKYLTMGSVPLLLLVAFVLSATGWRLGRLVPCVLAVLVALTTATNLEPDNLVRQDWRSAVGDLRVAQRPGDAVVVAPGLNVTPFMYYYSPGSIGPGPRGSVTGGVGGTPRLPPDVTLVLSHTNSAGEATSKVLPRLLETHTGGRIWLLTSLDEAYDPQDTLAGYLGANARLVERRHYASDMDLSLYEVPATPRLPRAWNVPSFARLLPAPPGPRAAERVS